MSTTGPPEVLATPRHAFQHGSRIATHLALTGRDPRVVRFNLPSPQSGSTPAAKRGANSSATALLEEPIGIGRR